MSPDTISDLRKLFDHTVGFCADTFRKTGQVRPMFVAITKAGEIMLIPVLEMSNAAQKDALIAEVKIILKAKEAVAVVFVTEAWMVVGPGAALSVPGSLEHHPDRIEVVSVSAEDKATVIHGHMQILRPEKGKAKLAPLQVHNDLKASGRMFGLLQ